MKFITHTKLVLTFSLVVAGSTMAVPQELLDGLSDESYLLREKAEIGLAKWAKKNGDKGIDDLNDLKKKSQSPEVKSRLDNVLSDRVLFEAIPGTRGYMGVSLLSMPGAVRINRVMPGTPAEKAGFQPDDMIIWVDGVALSKKGRHMNEALAFLMKYVKDKKSGEKLTVKIQRDGKVLNKVLKLADYDKEVRRQLENGGLDPFGDFNEIIPQVQPNRLQGQNNADAKQLRLEQDQLHLERLKRSPEMQKFLKKQKERNEKRQKQLKKELKLDSKKVPDE